jgi:hypothetical protein
MSRSAYNFILFFRRKKNQTLLLAYIHIDAVLALQQPRIRIIAINSVGGGTPGLQDLSK